VIEARVLETCRRIEKAQVSRRAARHPLRQRVGGCGAEAATTAAPVTMRRRDKLSSFGAMACESKSGRVDISMLLR
jgi:hypothetical protein